MSKLNLALLCSVAIVLSSCVSKSKFASLERERTDLEYKLAQSNDNVYNLEEEKAQYSITKKQLNRSLNNLEGQISKKEEEIQSLRVVINTISNGHSNISKAVPVSSVKFSPKENDINQEEISPISKLPNGFSDQSKPQAFVEDYYKDETSINFNSGSASVIKEDKTYIEIIADQFMNNPNVHFIIEGHADHRPMKPNARFKNNWELSKHRGDQVANVLIEMGVNPAQFTVVGMSDTEPKVSGYNLSTEELAINRRVEIFAQHDPVPAASSPLNADQISVSL